MISFVMFSSVTGTMVCEPFILREDTILEDVETFTVAIIDPGGAVLGSPSSATVTINDNDGQWRDRNLNRHRLCYVERHSNDIKKTTVMNASYALHCMTQ